MFLMNKWSGFFSILVLCTHWSVLEEYRIFFTQAASLQSIDASLSDNVIGTCRVEQQPANGETFFPKLEAYNKPSKSFQWYLYPQSPSKEEIDEYRAIPATLSKSHPNLAIGFINRMPQADKWVARGDTGWQLPADHLRNNKSFCLAMTRATVTAPKAMHESHKGTIDMYLIHVRHGGLLLESGIFGHPSCGYYQALETCETKFKFIGKQWWKQCSVWLSSSTITQFERMMSVLNEVGSTKSKNHQEQQESPVGKALVNSFRGHCLTNSSLEWKFVDKVFVITALWDHNYHHFLMDSLSRLIRYLPFLHNNPDIFIHIRYAEQYLKKQTYHIVGARIRQMFLSLLGISMDRIIFGPVIAKDIFFPRPIQCNNPIANAYEIRLLSKLLLENSYQQLRSSQRISQDYHLNQPHVLEKALQPFRTVQTPNIGSKSLRIIIQVRYCSTKKECKHWRGWTPVEIENVVEGFKSSFPTAQILTISDSDGFEANCIECELFEYHQADILVGLHGAGLTNIMFMRPNSVLIEITGQFDGRMMPVCGYHGPLAAIFGVHHYVYYYDWRGGAPLNSTDLALESRTFFLEVRDDVQHI